MGTCYDKSRWSWIGSDDQIVTWSCACPVTRRWFYCSCASRVVQMKVNGDMTSSRWTSIDGHSTIRRRRIRIVCTVILDIICRVYYTLIAFCRRSLVWLDLIRWSPLHALVITCCRECRKISYWASANKHVNGAQSGVFLKIEDNN